MKNFEKMLHQKTVVRVMVTLDDSPVEEPVDVPEVPTNRRPLTEVDILNGPETFGPTHRKPLSGPVEV